MRELILRTTPSADHFFDMCHRTWRQAIGDLNDHGTFRDDPNSLMPGYSDAPIWKPILSAALPLWDAYHGYTDHDAGRHHGLLYCATGRDMLQEVEHNTVEIYGNPVELTIASDTTLHGAYQHSGLIVVSRGRTFQDIGSTVRVILIDMKFLK